MSHTAPHPSRPHSAHGIIAPRATKKGITANWLTASSISTSVQRSLPELATLNASPATNAPKMPLTPMMPDTPRTSSATRSVYSRIGPVSVSWCRSEKCSALAAATPAMIPTTRAPAICQAASPAACPAVSGVATARATRTRGRASPSFAPDSSDRSWRSCSGRSSSASSPVTTLDARTGSVGQMAVPNSRASAKGMPSTHIASPVETSAIPGRTSTSSNASRRQCVLIAEKGYRRATPITEMARRISAPWWRVECSATMSGTSNTPRTAGPRTIPATSASSGSVTGHWRSRAEKATITTPSAPTIASNTSSVDNGSSPGQSDHPAP